MGMMSNSGEQISIFHNIPNFLTAKSIQKYQYVMYINSVHIHSPRGRENDGLGSRIFIINLTAVIRDPLSVIRPRAVSAKKLLVTS